LQEPFDTTPLKIAFDAILKLPYLITFCDNSIKILDSGYQVTRNSNSNLMRIHMNVVSTDYYKRILSIHTLEFSNLQNPWVIG